MYEIPCGQIIGHGERCDKVNLCARCQNEMGLAYKPHRRLDEALLAENQEGRTLDQLTGDDVSIEQKEVATETRQTVCTDKPALFEDGCHGIRADIELLKKTVKNWMSHPTLNAMEISDVPLNQREEIEENLTLAYRHLEDARMRIGKVIQAYDGGTSIYDKEKD